MNRRSASRGEMISTLCFLGMGAWFGGAAAAAPFAQAVVLVLCALACFAGAARQPLARILSRFL